ncbi:MAG: hypothetical protein WCD57_04100 [Acidobacteriaceae bacterium]
MFDHFPRIVLTNAFFDQSAMVFVKRKILRNGFIDNEASIPLLYPGNGI